MKLFPADFENVSENKIQIGAEEVEEMRRARQKNLDEGSSDEKKRLCDNELRERTYQAISSVIDGNTNGYSELGKSILTKKVELPREILESTASFLAYSDHSDDLRASAEAYRVLGENEKARNLDAKATRASIDRSWERLAEGTLS